VGNVLLGDEGAGVHLARALLAAPERLPAGVCVLEAGTALAACLGAALRAHSVWIVDAVRADAAPGTVLRAGPRRLAAIVAGTRPGVSLHDWGVAEFVAALAALSRRPPRVSLLGIVPARCAPGLELSRPVAHAVSCLAARATGAAATRPAAPRRARTRRTPPVSTSGLDSTSRPRPRRRAPAGS
jgi:hydrogenase maturation protease